LFRKIAELTVKAIKMYDKSVAVKGVGDGFKLIPEKDVNSENIIEETSKALEPIKHLLKGAHIYIDSEESSSEFVKILDNFLKNNFSVDSVAPFNNKDKVKTEHKKRFRTREAERGWKTSASDALIITGRVRSGQKIDTEKHLIIYGDVNPGAEVIAGGDILILGTLSGTAIAGQKQDDKSVIFSLDFRPTQIQINDIVGVGGERKNKKEPEIAFLNESRELSVKNYLEENPFSKLPWPEVR